MTGNKKLYLNWHPRQKYIPSFPNRQVWLKERWFSYQKLKKARVIVAFLLLSNLIWLILDDDLYGIYYLPQWLHKSKYLLVLCFCYPCAIAVYFCMFLHYAITQWRKLGSIDILIAAGCLEVENFNFRCLRMLVCPVLGNSRLFINFRRKENNLTTQSITSAVLLE